jgi:amino acid recemase, putative
VLIPDQAGITEVNRIIYDELCLGDIKESSKQTYLAVIDDLKKAGAEVVILGCTEIGLLVKQFDTDLSLYDTTVIHAEKAAEWSIE